MTHAPGAAVPQPEVCNGQDEDCNGQTDENCANCTDGDGDGYCAGQGDCNDSSATVNPTVVDTCGNGIDDNCNGAIDENCGVNPQGGNSSSGCAGGSESLPVLAGLMGMGLLLARRRRV